MFFISMETYGNKSRSIVRDQVGAAKTRNEITFLRVAFTIAAVTHITTRKKNTHSSSILFTYTIILHTITSLSLGEWRISAAKLLELLPCNQQQVQVLSAFVYSKIGCKWNEVFSKRLIHGSLVSFTTSAKCLPLAVFLLILLEEFIFKNQLHVRKGQRSIL